jgi:hypothetical protein
MNGNDTNINITRNDYSTEFYFPEFPSTLFDEIKYFSALFP